MKFLETINTKSEEDKLLIAGTSYIITYKRWLILAVVSMAVFLDIFSVSFFGFINDVTTPYFKITPAQTDLLSALNVLPQFMVGFVLALCANNLNLKSISITIGILTTVSSLIIVTGVSSRSNSLIILIGQLVNGTSTAMAITLAQIAPSNWFPNNECGKAVSVTVISRRLSPVVSNIIATRTINEIQQNIRFANTTDNNDFDETSLVTCFRGSFQIVFSVLALIAFVYFILSVFYVTDYPPTVDGTPATSMVQKPINLTSELRSILSFFINKRYIILLVMHVVILSSKPMLEWMLSSIVLKGFPELDDGIVGTMFCVGYSVVVFGSPISGALIDRYRRPKVIYAVAMAAITLTYGLFSFAIYIHSFNLLFVSYVIIASLRDLCLVCVVHATIELMKDCDSTKKIQAFSIAGSLPSISVVGYSSLIRFGIERGTPTTAVLIPVPFHVVAAILYVCVY